MARSAKHTEFKLLFLQQTGRNTLVLPRIWTYEYIHITNNELILKNVVICKKT